MYDQPMVSVLMTAYNRENYIAEAIQSVLESTFTNFELVIADDGSKDRTVEIAKAYSAKDPRVKVFVNEKNLGDYPNRNKAASLATGRYIKYLDSDDVMYAHCLQVMVSGMEKFPEAGYGLSAVGDAKKPYPVCITPHEAYVENFGGQGHFGRAPGSAIIKKEAFDKVGGFSGLRQVGDFEFWLKIGSTYPLVKLPVDLYWSRLHDGEKESNVNSDKEKHQLRLDVIKKIFATENVPLSDAEKQQIISSIKRGYLKNVVRKLAGV